jgi:hypothetical protein
VDEQGQRIVQEFLGVQIQSSPWNNGTGSVMLTRDVMMELMVFCLLYEDKFDRVLKVDWGYLGCSDKEYAEVCANEHVTIEQTWGRLFSGPSVGSRNVHVATGRVA